MSVSIIKRTSYSSYGSGICEYEYEYEFVTSFSKNAISTVPSSAEGTLVSDTRTIKVLGYGINLI